MPVSMAVHVTLLFTVLYILQVGRVTHADLGIGVFLDKTL